MLASRRQVSATLFSGAHHGWTPNKRGDVYELEDPTGIRYRMQSFTQGQDPDQQLVDLQRLGQRLDLPQGWTFHVILLEEDARLPTLDGIAEVITDDLGNTYQRVP